MRVCFEKIEFVFNTGDCGLGRAQDSSSVGAEGETPETKPAQAELGAIGFNQPARVLYRATHDANWRSFEEHSYGVTANTMPFPVDPPTVAVP
jgi:hypothetical protein